MGRWSRSGTAATARQRCLAARAGMRYGSSQPLWMGCTWIMSNRLYTNAPTPAEDEQSVIFMTMDAMGFHVPEDITTYCKRDPSISYAWRPYAEFTAGAVRVEDEHLVWLKLLDDSVPAP